MNDLGKNIRKLRENAGINQRDFAKMLDIGNTTLSQYESGARIPSDEVKIKIADYFDVSIDYLLGREREDGIVEIVTREDAVDQLKRINKILLDEGAITEEEYKYGIKDKEKERKLMEIVKKAIKFSIEVNKMD